MEQYVIRGGNPLVGEVEIGGAKNAALAILTAATMTDETVLIENLPDGTYTLTEVTSPDGYQKAESITFTVTDGIVENGPVTMYDNPVSVKISKQDITTHAELPGAKLTVSNKATGQVVDTWISTDTPHEITGLKDGVYLSLIHI